MNERGIIGHGLLGTKNVTSKFSIPGGFVLLMRATMVLLFCFGCANNSDSGMISFKVGTTMKHVKRFDCIHTDRA